MGKIKGFVLDSALHSLARDIVEVQNSGMVIDVNQTLSNWNEKHQIADNTEQLQNDVNLFIELEKQRQLSSLNALGYTSYKTGHYLAKAKDLMSIPLGSGSSKPAKNGR